MPLHSIQELPAGSKLAIWKINESKKELTQLLGDRVDDNSRPTNAAENVGIHWFASRVCLSAMFPGKHVRVQKDRYNKPTLYINREPWFISITHSFEFAGILVSRHAETGIDIEKIDPRVNRVSHKFLNEAEQLIAFHQDETFVNTLIWSAKETLYKVYGRKSMDFKENLHIHPFLADDSGILLGKITNPGIDVLLDIHYSRLENYIVTFALHSDDE
ncbi:4'-phosphopantetheinyl transferase superfamily protein [Bacteroidota bacterium]